MRRTTSFALAAPLCACLDQPPEYLWTGEHVQFDSDSPDDVCAGTLDYVDRRAGQLIERFGAGPRMIQYHYFPDGIEEWCDDDAGACTIGSEIYALHIPYQHELVHAARPGFLPLAFEEGLATHWGDPWPLLPIAGRDVLPGLLDSQAIDGIEEYQRVGHFMAFLSERSGRESLVELDRQLDIKSSPAQIRAALVDIYGAGLDELLQEYAEYPECIGMVDVSLYCEGEAIVLGESASETSVEIDCANADAVGPFYGSAFVDRVVELGPALGVRVMAATGEAADHGGRVLLRRCGPCSENGVRYVSSSAPAIVSEEQLPAGRYAVRFIVPVDAGPTTLGLHVE